MCYIVCEKIQRWREQFVGSKENLENAQTEFQKRKNCLAPLYNKSSHGQTHEWRKEGAVMSVRTNDNDNEEVEKQRKITMITKKIWSEVELVSTLKRYDKIPKYLDTLKFLNIWTPKNS